MKSSGIGFKSIVVLVFIICGTSTNTLYSQSSDKDDSNEDVRLNADAYALAYGLCKVQIAKYQSEQNASNSMLSREFKKISLTYNKFSVNINARYKADENLFEKFTRKVKNAHKQLSTCIRYQSMLDANANIEKAKAERSQ